MSLNELINPTVPLNINVANLTVNGTLDAKGGIEFDTLDVTGNGTIGGTLEVKGATTLDGTLEVKGVTTLDGELVAGSNNFTVDGTTGALLMTDGGITVGSSGILTSGALTVGSTTTGGTGGLILNTENKTVRVKAATASVDRNHSFPDTTDANIMLTTATQTCTGTNTFNGSTVFGGAASLESSSPVLHVDNTSATGSSQVSIKGASGATACTITSDATGKLTLATGTASVNLELKTITGGNVNITGNNFNVNGAAYSDSSKNIGTRTLTNGQILIGSTGASPVAGTITSSGSSILVTPGTGTLDLSVIYSTSTSYTPTLTFGGSSFGITYAGGGQVGTYIINGNVVFVNVKIILTSKGTDTGQARISLPVTSSSTAISNINFASYFNINEGTSPVGCVGIVQTSGTTADLFTVVPLDGSLTSVTDAGMADDSNFTFSGFYFAG